MSEFDSEQERLAREASGQSPDDLVVLCDAELAKLRAMISRAENRQPVQQWTKVELEDWCRSWCRTPHTTLKAFIDAGFCSDQEPSREETRLLHR